MNSSPALTLPAFYQAQLHRLLAYQQALEAELAKRSLQDLPIEKLFRLSDLVNRQLQRLLKAAASVSNQIKPDQASSGVEVAILAAGQGGFQPPVPPPPPSTQIKVNQASGAIAATDASRSALKVQSSTFKVLPPNPFWLAAGCPKLSQNPKKWWQWQAAPVSVTDEKTPLQTRCRLA